VLSEIKNVRQEGGPGRRRWFETDGLELVVWIDERETVTGFQLCYDFGRGEHALTWRATGGFVHNAVDPGDANPLKNQTPILVQDGIVPWERIRQRFEQSSGRLEPALRQLIHQKLAASPDQPSRR
jgi:hypothetical protein